MTRGLPALAGAALLLLAFVSLGLPFQSRPLLLLALAALVVLSVARREAAAIALALALVPLLPVTGNLLRGPWVSPSETLLLLAAGSALLFGSAPREPVRRSPLGLCLAASAIAAAVGGIAATLAAVPGWALPAALLDLATGFPGAGDHAAGPIRAAAVHAVPLLSWLLVRRLLEKLPASRLLGLLAGSMALVGAYGVLEALFSIRLWPRAAYDPYAAFARVVSTLPDHNASATLLALFLFPAAGLALEARGRRRVAAWTVTLLVAVGLVLTGSRAAWLGTLAAAGIGAAFAARRRISRPALAASAALLLVAASAAFLWPGTTGWVLRARVRSLVSPAEARRAVRYGRLPFWQAGVSMVAAHPLAGVGPGRVPAHLAEHRPSGFPVERENLHSWPLQALAENGVVGGLLLLAPFAALLSLVRRGLTREGPGSSAAVLLSLGLLSATLSGLASHPWLLVEVQALFWSAAALLEHRLEQPLGAADLSPSASRPDSPSAPGLLAGRLPRLLFTALLAWGIPRLALAPGSEPARFGYGFWGFGEGEARYGWAGPRALIWLPRERLLTPAALGVRRPEPGPSGPPAVTIRVDGGARGRGRAAGEGWTLIRAPEGGARVSRELSAVEVTAGGAFCPASRDGGDRRVLAVQVRRP